MIQDIRPVSGSMQLPNHHGRHGKLVRTLMPCTKLFIKQSSLYWTFTADGNTMTQMSSTLFEDRELGNPKPVQPRTWQSLPGNSGDRKVWKGSTTHRGGSSYRSSDDAENQSIPQLPVQWNSYC